MDKRTALGTAAVVLAAAAGVGSLLRADDSGPPAVSGSGELGPVLERIESLERRLALIESGRGTAEVASQAEVSLERPNEAEAGSAIRLAPSEASVPDDTAAGATADRLLAEVDHRVDRAVEKKVAEVEADRKLKQNKKPSLGTFSDALELDPNQRRLVDEEIRVGQRQIRDILETPTANGESLLDELIDAMAHGAAKRADTGPLFSKWYGRLMTLIVPGTTETYAAKLETVKGTVREGLRRELNDTQYAEFEAWGLDPTEIQDVTNTPWADFEQLVDDRAAALAPQ